MDRYEMQASAHRLAAGLLRMKAAEYDTLASVCLATGALRSFVSAAAVGDASDIAGHPDLAELNVRLDGYYEAPR